MLRSNGSRGFGGVLTVGFQILMAGTALAHHPTIVASAVCNEGKAIIQYTSTSWSSLPREGENSRIDIAVNGVVVASGAYVYGSGNTFSGVTDAPAGATATVSATAVALWGNGHSAGQSESTTVSIPADCSVTGTGRFTGGGSQIRVDGVRVTRGLTIHCDLLLSNNLEINWNGHRFHMLEHMRTVRCSDDPLITQAPPAAPLDTLIGVGTGRYDNEDGYTVEFTLVDYGEPGRDDQMAIKVFKGASVVLDVPLQVLSGGNLQAHYDQPHK